MAEHAPKAPSAAPQWGICSGSIRAQANRPSYETEKSRAGTATHWVCSEVLIAHKVGAVHVTAAHYIGRKAPNGVIIDSTMADGAQVYIDDVLAVCAQFGALDRLQIEHRVYMPRIHPDNWGTLDAALWLPERNLLFEWDYKNGNRPRFAWGDLQMVDYAAGLVEQHHIDTLTAHAVIRVVQPFSYRAGGPVNEWYGPLHELRPFWNQLHHKAHEADNNPTLTPGLHCRDCTALTVCSAGREYAYTFADLVDRPYAMDEMTGADMAVELSILEDCAAVAKKRIEALREEVRHQIEQGDNSSGLTLEVTPGREEWADETPQVVALADQFGVNIRKDGILTPVQARAAAPAAVRNAFKSVIQTHVRRRAGSTKLIPMSESRAAQAFQPKHGA